jgi:hypothetical protein
VEYCCCVSLRSNLGIHKEIFSLAAAAVNAEVTPHLVVPLRSLMTASFTLLAVFARNNPENQRVLWDNREWLLRWIGAGVGAEVALGEVWALAQA